MKLDLGCGQNKREGFTGVDVLKIEGVVDVEHNLDVTPWPFESGCVEEAYSSHFIEHTKDLICFMDELHRVLKVGGTAQLIAPYYSSVRAWQDPTHVRAISENTFLYFNKAWRDENRLDHYGIKSNFEYSYGYVMDPMWEKRSDNAKMFAIKHYINVVSDIVINLKKI